MRRAAAAGLAVLLLAGLLAACLPTGGVFGYPGSRPRPEFAGSPMMPAATDTGNGGMKDGRRTGSGNL